MLQRLAEPVQVGGQQVRIGASIGIAFYPTDGRMATRCSSMRTLRSIAPRPVGRGTFRFFDPQMTHAVNENRLLESGLRRALDNQELELHFQPKFACESLTIVGFEALAALAPSDARRCLARRPSSASPRNAA